MKRFFGMMPRSEVEVEKFYSDGIGISQIAIEAGPKGWTVMFADRSAEYNDCEDTVENNLQAAIQVLKNYFPDAYEING